MSHLLSKRASSRTISHFSSGPGDVPPAGFKKHDLPLLLNFGTPNPGFFPVESIQVNVVDYPFQFKTGPHSQPAGIFEKEETGEKKNGGTNGSTTNGSTTNGSTTNGTTTNGTKNGTKNGSQAQDAIVPITIEKYTKNKDLIDLATGLQYANVKGIPQLLDFTKKLITRTHKPGYEDWDITLSNGAGDGLNKAADALLDVNDIILIEEFTFTPFLQNVKNAGAIPVPVKLNISNDSNGIDLEYLEDLLKNWKQHNPELSKPKALYTISTGQNPTGLTQSIEFRKKVYKLAEEYDFAIIEDDPYGYLTLPPFKKPEETIDYDNLLDVEDYLTNHLTPSYLTIDTSGRVIRVETFSKLFAPGLRLGFIVGHKKVIDAIANYAAVVTRTSSGTSQVLVNNVIEQKWGGLEGWLTWILKMRLTYAHRRDVLAYVLSESDAYKKKYFEIIDPKAGMFIAVRLNFPEGTDIPSKIKLLVWKFLAAGVAVVPGLNMAVDKKFSELSATFFRLTYAIANNDEELSEGGRRLATAIDEFFEKGLEF